jgi:hypothetical protein
MTTTILINNFWHENKEIIRLKDKIKISLDSIESIKKTIKDDEEKIKSHELNNLRLSSRLSSEEFKTFLYYILHSNILDNF